MQEEQIMGLFKAVFSLDLVLNMARSVPGVMSDTARVIVQNAKNDLQAFVDAAVEESQKQTAAAKKKGANYAEQIRILGDIKKNNGLN